MGRAGLVAWMRLAKVYQKIQRREAAHLAGYGLTVAQFDVLAQLGAIEGLTQQQLADKLLVTKGNVCGLVDRMSEQGWLERRNDPHDRRSNLLYLTQTGRKLANQIVPLHSAMIESLMDALSSDDQHVLAAMLRRVDHSLNAVVSGEPV
jgi:DNA-binding MarR family transcriptional regulator